MSIENITEDHIKEKFPDHSFINETKDSNQIISYEQKIYNYCAHCKKGKIMFSGSIVYKCPTCGSLPKMYPNVFIFSNKK